MSYYKYQNDKTETALSVEILIYPRSPQASAHTEGTDKEEKKIDEVWPPVAQSRAVNCLLDISEIVESQREKDRNALDCSRHCLDRECESGE